jgi:hypothetical protein
MMNIIVSQRLFIHRSNELFLIVMFKNKNRGTIWIFFIQFLFNVNRKMRLNELENHPMMNPQTFLNIYM